MRVSYSGYYIGLPIQGREFDFLYPLSKSYSSVGSECNFYKVEVVGSNPTGTTNFKFEPKFFYIYNKSMYKNEM